LIARELDKTRVKGKTQAVSIYELIGLAGDRVDSDLDRFLELYHCGRKAYSQRHFRKALDYFLAARELHPQDRGTLLHIQRSQNYLSSPPPESWDGIYTMTAK
jgi:adenylate cyclase